MFEIGKFIYSFSDNNEIDLFNCFFFNYLHDFMVIYINIYTIVWVISKFIIFPERNLVYIQNKWNYIYMYIYVYIIEIYLIHIVNDSEM